MIKIFTKQNQKGMSAILLAMFFIVVISLITLGFSTLARHDQRAALDKTLSNQASYAAESGINAAKSYLETQTSPSVNDNCNPPASINGFIKPNLDPAAEVTCLKWAEGARSVTVGLKKGTPVWIPFESANSSSSIASVKVKWSNNNSVFSGCDSSSINGINDDTFPVLRVIASNTNMSSSNVNYLCPKQGGPGVLADGSSDGNIGVASSCSSQTCTATINNPVNGLLALVQLNGNYQTTATLTGYTGLNGSGEEVTFKGIYTIDSTAKSQDVIKRVKAVYSKGGASTYGPGQFVVNSNGDLCKNFKVDGSNNNVAGPISPESCPDEK